MPMDQPLFKSLERRSSNFSFMIWLSKTSMSKYLQGHPLWKLMTFQIAQLNTTLSKLPLPCIRLTGETLVNHTVGRAHVLRAPSGPLPPYNYIIELYIRTRGRTYMYHVPPCRQGHTAAIFYVGNLYIGRA